ncbi:hypothetical protein BDZ91DRAFT_761029 [Kalaharituber pfeilii]|nr:hypothetical protein BDZ91DRAFT_761029 [Kalaharituber pfeilii]
MGQGIPRGRGGRIFNAHPTSCENLRYFRSNNGPISDSATLQRWPNDPEGRQVDPGNSRQLLTQRGSVNMCKKAVGASGRGGGYNSERDASPLEPTLRQWLAPAHRGGTRSTHDARSRAACRTVPLPKLLLPLALSGRESLWCDCEIRAAGIAAYVRSNALAFKELVDRTIVRVRSSCMGCPGCQFMSLKTLVLDQLVLVHQFRGQGTA